jgi:uncharacterized lipoprotein YajG
MMTYTRVSEIRGGTWEAGMNFRGRSLNRLIAAAVLAGAAMLNGCAITAVPGQVPAQKGMRQQNLTGVSLVVLSASQDASPYPILTEAGVDVGFVYDRRTWSGKLAEALAGELARNGAVLRTTASLKLSVAVKEVTVVQAGEINQFKVKVSASSSRGWSKDFEASAEATTGAFETVDSMTRRLAGMSLAGVIKVMLDDRDFLAQLKNI